MSAPVYIRSLLPQSSVYRWDKDGCWELMDDGKFPNNPWISHQTGLQVSLSQEADIVPPEFFPTFMGRLEEIHKDLVQEAIEVVGVKHTTGIPDYRWNRLYNPRPVDPTKIPATGDPILFASRGTNLFSLHVSDKGIGGWYRVVDGSADLSNTESFKLWDYTMHVSDVREEKHFKRVEMKRIVCATLDALYLYRPDDLVTKSYLTYVQPKIKQLCDRKQ